MHPAQFWQFADQALRGEERQNPELQSYEIRLPGGHLNRIGKIVQRRGNTGSFWFTNSYPVMPGSELQYLQSISIFSHLHNCNLKPN